MRFPLVAACSLLALSVPLPARAAPDPQAAKLYLNAVHVMQALPQPAFAQYTSMFTGEKTGFQVVRSKDGKASFFISTGGPSPGPLPTAYRSAGRLSAFALKEGPAHTKSAIADPTWAGAATFARYGISPPDDVPATPAPAASGDLAEIGTVSVFSVAFYTVSDAGPATCPGGTRGEALHLIAFREPNTHPLTDAIVESGTQRICSMKFKLHLNGAISYAPLVELHFAQVGGYYLSTDGFIDGDVHVLALAVKHTHVRIERSSFTFPDTIPQATFTGT